MKKEEARKLLKIDRLNLTSELEKQPEIYDEVSEMCVYAISVRDSLKDEKERIWSEQFLSAKRNSAIDGKTPSDKVAETMADTSKEFVEVSKSFLEAKKDADEWIGIKESFQQRMEMLRELNRILSRSLYNEASESSYDRIKKQMRKE